MLKGCLAVVAGIFLISLVFAVFLASKRNENSIPLSQNERDIAEAAALTDTAHKLLLVQLKDPESATFDYDLPRRSGLFCGTVRAKNSFGGYGSDIYYILFMFGVVNSESENGGRFKRLWNLYCMDGPKTAGTPTTPNRDNDVVLRANDRDRAWMLGRIVGGSCIGQNSYFMGSGDTASSKDVAFWSLRCQGGTTYEIGFWPDKPARVLECRALEQLHAGRCFKRVFE